MEDEAGTGARARDEEDGDEGGVWWEGGGLLPHGE